uniref:Peptidase S1 domain-containing protein n=1 Tax=Anopheles dirus TaxID=7168 RepID=A0A182NPS1_9DIPT
MLPVYPLIAVQCLLLIDAAFGQQGTHKSCVLPKGDPGQCVPHDECAEMIAFADKSTLYPNERFYITTVITACGSHENAPNVIVCCKTPPAPSLHRTDYTQLTSTFNLRLEDILPTECGLRPLDEKIVGGVQDDQNGHTWAALLKIEKGRGKPPGYCGGTLIHADFVLTAAHCFYPNVSAVTLYFGMPNTRRLEQCSNDTFCQVRTDAEIIRHHSFRYHGLVNDIALVRVDKSVQTGEATSVVPACLPVNITLNDILIHDPYVYIVGWGATETDIMSDVRLVAMMQIEDLNDCRAKLRNSNKVVSSNVICATGINGADVCSGDSGGPMVQKFKHKFYVIGVVNHGPLCSQAKVPSVFSNVFSHMGWILEELNRHHRQLNRACMLANGNQGRCVQLRDCSEIAKLYRKKVCCERPRSSSYSSATTNTTNRPTTTTTTTRDPEETTTTIAVTNIQDPLEDILPTECGLLSLSPQITDDVQYESDTHVWVTFLEILDYSSNSAGWCVGTLIHERFVLTAAHCFKTRNENVLLYIGVTSLGALRECLAAGSCQNRTDAGLIIHHDYNSHTFSHDIALIRLGEPVTREMGIIPACLPLDRTRNGGASGDTRVISLGWGKTRAGTFSNTKTLAKLHKLAQAECAEQLKTQSSTIVTNVMCTVRESENDPCQGDSGEPILQLHDNRVSVIGVANFGPKCGTSAVPSVSTKVSAYMGWILTNLNGIAMLEIPTPATSTIPPILVNERFSQSESILPAGCGVDIPTVRIANGVEDDANIHVWAVFLEIVKHNSFTGRCVGTLIHERFVLTAAHCLHTPKENVKLYFGVNLLSELDNGVTQNRTAAEFIIHHDYNSHTLSNDIALIRVNEPVRFGPGSRILPACLPVNGRLPEELSNDPNVIALGWGNTMEGILSDRKMLVMLEVLTQDECAERLQNNTRFYSTIRSNVVCTIGNLPGQDVCQGDSGAPIIQLVDQRYYVIGVVSFGPKCGMSTVPSVSTNVSMYMDWIQTKISESLQ